MLRTWCLIFVICLSSAFAEADSHGVRVAFSPLSGEQNTRFKKLLSEQSKYQGVDIKVFSYDGDSYKKHFKKWMDQGSGPDVLYWQGGQRLYDFVEEGKVCDLSELWKVHRLDQHFKHTKSAVSTQNKRYGVPFLYYNWGFFYNRDIFDRFDLEVPQTWMELLYVSEKLKERGVTPFVVGTKDKWVPTAWFDFLVLRLYGQEFYRDLMEGKISYQSHQVKSVFEHWKQLIDENYFHPKALDLTLNHSFPFIYRDTSAMYLASNISSRLMSEDVKNKVGFFRFPVINSEVSIYEQAPTDIFIIPQYSKNKDEAFALMRYLSSSYFQTAIAVDTGAVPARSDANISTEKFTEAALSIIQASEGVVQTYDRENKTDMAAQGVQIIGEFLQNGDIERTTQKLELARIKTYGRM